MDDNPYKIIELSGLKLKVYYDGRVYRGGTRNRWSLLRGTIIAPGRRLFSFNYQHHLAHRVIARAWLEDYEECLQVDHINRDQLDNRVDNLRMCTNQQNHFNTGGQGIRRVRDRWQARLSKDGVEVYNKTFDTKEEALAARYKAEQYYFKSFAPLRSE